MSDDERRQLLQIIDAQSKTIAGMNATLASQTSTIDKLREDLASMSQKLDAALRQLHGKKSERKARPNKLPPVAKPEATTETALKKRKANREAMALTAVDEGEQEHPVASDQQQCGHCGEHADFRPVGDGKSTELFDYVPGYFRRSRHVVHTMACTCGKTIVSGRGPERATAGSKYGPGLAAWLIVHKCLLSMPIYRVEKLLRGYGIPVSRSTMNELLHRVAFKLEPIYDELIRLVREADIVLADETPLKLVSHDKQAFIWVFLGDGNIVYRFAEGRGSVNAIEMLGGTKGTLLTDGFSGYKPLIAEAARQAAGCMAHIRRKFHEAIPTAAEAEHAMVLIGELYDVEHQAQAMGIVGTEEHLRMRQQRAGPVMGRLKKWMRERLAVVPPKSPLGKAIRHALSRWKPALIRFLYDPNVPLDNNASERALRVVALGRKNFYGAGSKDGGRVLAILYSLVSTCEAAGVDPFAYLRDVITRVDNEPPAMLTPAAWAAASPA